MATTNVEFRMLDASTAHLMAQTRERMSDDALDGVLFYPKGPWGWFVHVPCKEDGIELAAEVPEDVKTCIGYAQAHGFHWIMFDGDGAFIDDLPIYEEETPSGCDIVQATTVLSQAYARHLSAKHGTTVLAEEPRDGKICVREDRPGGMRASVSPEFAQAMIMAHLPVIDPAAVTAAT